MWVCCLAQRPREVCKLQLSIVPASLATSSATHDVDEVILHAGLVGAEPPHQFSYVQDRGLLSIEAIDRKARAGVWFLAALFSVK